MRKRSAVAIATLALSVLPLRPGHAQQPTPEDLKKEIEALEETLAAIQRDIREIKALLQGRQAPAPERSVSLDLGDHPTRGEPTAPLTLIEFSDYQCPYCSRYVRETFPRLEKEYIETGKLRYVFFDLPIESIHRLAFRAAEAARCGGAQGRYWEMHAELFANQARLEPFSARAEAVGLDVPRFEECMSRGESRAGIRKDIAEARRAGLTGTPSFLFAVAEGDGEGVRSVGQIRGAKSFAAFKSQIDDLLAAASSTEDAAQ